MMVDFRLCWITWQSHVLLIDFQVESAQKATETAESALQAERASSRSFLFTEEEMKSFQLQVILISSSSFSSFIFIFSYYFLFF